MIPRTEEEQKKEALRLFEDGRYQESLDICHVLLETVKDPTLEILAATNLFYTGKLEDAEVFFRDIAQKVPESSYVHSFLANVLEKRGDDGAIAEYALAVHLDPTNLAALRSYADYLMVRNDFLGALPVLKRLVEAGKKPSDVQDLMRALVATGNAEEALFVSTRYGSEHTRTGEYVDALITLQSTGLPLVQAGQIYKETRDIAMLRRHLTAGSLDDPHVRAGGVCHESCGYRKRRDPGGLRAPLTGRGKICRCVCGITTPAGPVVPAPVPAHGMRNPCSAKKRHRSDRGV